MARHYSVCISHNQTTMSLELKLDYIVKLLSYWRGKGIRNHNLEIDLHLTVKIIYLYDKTCKIITPWASYQIRKIVCAHAPWNAGNVFPATAGKRSRHASRHVRDARAVMHAGGANLRFHLKSAAGENVPGIPGACATRNFTHLARGPLQWRHISITRSESAVTRLFSFNCFLVANMSSTLLAPCEGSPLVTDRFPSQRAGNAKSVSMPWLHRDHW